MRIKLAIFISLWVCSLTLTLAQQFLTKEMEFDGLSREYIVYVPNIYDSSSSVPLLFNFHGLSGTAANQFETGYFQAIADTAGFIVVYPQGSLLNDRVSHWNSGTTNSTSDDLGFVEALIDTLAQSYNIDQGRVYATGKSDGGFFCFELACFLSDRIAAIGSVSGVMSNRTIESCDPSNSVPVITIHGTNDFNVSYNGRQNYSSVDETLEYWIIVNNTDSAAIITNLPDTDPSEGTMVEYLNYANGDNCTSVEHYKVIGGGHVWPGTEGGTNIGAFNNDIDADSVIWNFVSKYNINGLIGCVASNTIDEIQDGNGIHVYPNPSKDFVSIEIKSLKNEVYHIYTSIGKHVLSGMINSDDKRIDISELPSNIYFLQVGTHSTRLIKVE